MLLISFIYINYILFFNQELRLLSLQGETEENKVWEETLQAPGTDPTAATRQNPSDKPLYLIHANSALSVLCIEFCSICAVDSSEIKTPSPKGAFRLPTVDASLYGEPH